MRHVEPLHDTQYDKNPIVVFREAIDERAAANVLLGLSYLSLPTACSYAGKSRKVMLGLIRNGQVQTAPKKGKEHYRISTWSLLQYLEQTADRIYGRETIAEALRHVLGRKQKLGWKETVAIAEHCGLTLEKEGKIFRASRAGIKKLEATYTFGWKNIEDEIGVTAKANTIRKYLRKYPTLQKARLIRKYDGKHVYATHDNLIILQQLIKRKKSLRRSNKRRRSLSIPNNQLA
jgi:hypothetical protein